MLRALLLLFLLSLVSFSCNQRYAYLSKVRVGKKEVVKRNSLKDKKEDATATEENPWQEAEASIAPERPGSWPQKQLKKEPKVKPDQAKSFQKQKPVEKKKATPPLNYFAQRGRFFSFITLATSFFFYGTILGPLDVALGVAALMQIRKTGERGSGWAYFSILAGIFLTLVMLLFLWMVSVDIPMKEIWYVLIPIALLNYFLFKLIQRKSQKIKPPQAEDNVRSKVDTSTKLMFASTALMAILTVMGAPFLIGTGLGPALVWRATVLLKRIPKDRSGMKFWARLFDLIGILATLGFVAFTMILLFSPMTGEGSGFILIFYFLTLTVALISTLLVLINFMNSQTEAEETKQRKPINLLSILSFLAAVGAMFLSFSDGFFLLMGIAMLTGMVSVAENIKFGKTGTFLSIMAIFGGLLSFFISFTDVRTINLFQNSMRSYVIGLGIALVISAVHYLYLHAAGAAQARERGTRKSWQ